jgi:hypothetical protein
VNLRHAPGWNLRFRQLFIAAVGLRIEHFL